MTFNIEKKKAVVDELSVIANQAVSAVAADYRGLTVSQMTALRKGARAAGVNMRVYRNTLARRAIKETPYACLDEVLIGPIVLLFSQEEPGAAARLVRDFIKEHERLEVRALAMGGVLFPPEKLKTVASLPSRVEALTQLVSVLKAPMVKWVRTLNEPVAQTVRVLAAVRDQKQA